MSSERDYTDPANMRDVIEQSSRDDWRYFDAPATWVLKTNRDFSIELLDQGARNDRSETNQNGLTYSRTTLHTRTRHASNTEVRRSIKNRYYNLTNFGQQ